MPATIKVIITSEDPYIAPTVYGIKLDETLLKEIQEPIHEETEPFLIDPTVPIPEALAFTSEKKIKITKNREYWTKKLGNLITKALLNHLESNDTIDGYLKKDL